VAIGHGGKLALSRLRSSASGLYPIITTAFALGSYGITALLGGSGFLAVYLSALIIGNGQIPFRAGVLRVHDALAWLSQITMFLILGLLVYPSRLLEIAIPGVLIALFLAVVARPLMVAACLLPFRFKLPEIAYVGWVGLRGAVPIILATVRHRFPDRSGQRDHSRDDGIGGNAMARHGRGGAAVSTGGAAHRVDATVRRRPHVVLR
jgi:potassium/hydrogen antiporter